MALLSGTGRLPFFTRLYLWRKQYFVFKSALYIAPHILQFWMHIGVDLIESNLYGHGVIVVLRVESYPIIAAKARVLPQYFLCLHRVPIRNFGNMLSVRPIMQAMCR